MSLVLGLNLIGCGDDGGPKPNESDTGVDVVDTVDDVGDTGAEDITTNPADTVEDTHVNPPDTVSETPDVIVENRSTGDACNDDSQCSSGQCEEFGSVSICTESCTTTCMGLRLSCFEGLCAPSRYCESDDGYGFGPGCEGVPCARCSENATCTDEAPDYPCQCNEGYEGDGVTCTDLDECALGTDDCAFGACNNTAGSFTCECPLGTEGDGYTCTAEPSCAALRAAQPELADGLYFIEPEGAGQVEVYCDMTSDGGVGHTMLRIEDATLAEDQDAYRAACAARGMEVVVPRSRAHAAALTAYNNDVKPNLINVFPKQDGAVGLDQWEGRCEGAACSFYVSNTNNFDCPEALEPSGDNTTAYSLYRLNDEDGCGFGQWGDANNTVVDQGYVICSTNDTTRRVRASCQDYLARDEVFNAGPEGLSGIYTLDNASGEYPVYCDMTTDGGGWTYVWKNTSYDNRHTDTFTTEGKGFLLSTSSNRDLWASTNSDPVLPYTWQFMPNGEALGSALHRKAMDNFGSLPEQEWIKIGSLWRYGSGDDFSEGIAGVEVHSQTIRAQFNGNTWLDVMTTTANCRELPDEIAIYVNGDNFAGQTRHMKMFANQASFGLANSGGLGEDTCDLPEANLINNETLITQLVDVNGTLSSEGRIGVMRHYFSYQHASNTRDRSRCFYRCWGAGDIHYDDFVWAVRGPLVYDSCDEVRQVDPLAPTGTYRIDDGVDVLDTQCDF